MTITQQQVNEAVKALGLDPDRVAQVRMTAGGVWAETWDGNPRCETEWRFWEVQA